MRAEEKPEHPAKRDSREVQNLTRRGQLRGVVFGVTHSECAVSVLGADLIPGKDTASGKADLSGGAHH